MTEAPGSGERARGETPPVIFLHAIDRRYRQGAGTLEILKSAELAVWGGQSVALDRSTLAPEHSFKTVEEMVNDMMRQALGYFEDDEEEVSAPHAAIEELEEESAEPLPEWKVMAWNDLLATLYRPQDR